MSTATPAGGASPAPAFGRRPTPDRLPRWVLGVAGLLTAAVGVAALVWPKPSLGVVGILFGVYLLVWGVGMLVSGAGRADVTAGLRVLDILVGVLAVLAGLFLVVRPGDSVVAIAQLLGFWWCLVGVVQLVRGIVDAHDRAARFLWGVVSLAVGVLVLAQPEIALGTLVLFVGIGLIVQGALEMMLAFTSPETLA